MAVCILTVKTRASPSFRVFWLHSRPAGYLEDMRAAGTSADAQDVGFVGSAVAVRTVIDTGAVGVVVEIWNRRPLLLHDESFEYAAEGSVEFSDGRWCIDEAQDAAVRSGVALREGPGWYGVRVTAYGLQRVTDILDDSDHYSDAMRTIAELPPDDSERYRLQIWPQDE